MPIWKRAPTVSRATSVRGECNADRSSPCSSHGRRTPMRLCSAFSRRARPTRPEDHVYQGFSLAFDASVEEDLIVPISARFDFDTVAEIGDHVKAGIDPIIKVMEKMELR